jgi:hypothetical protein
LNILRLIILDAPLAKEVAPIAGDATIAAILGYADLAWSVRNSSTMVFAAVMLRVIDADKNASNTDRTSSNAITVTELFRRYPALSSFLQAVMRADIVDGLDKAVDSQSFPVLLLLSRVQSSAHSESKVDEQTKSLIPLVIESLNHRHHSIRSAAACALANLCTGAGSSSAAALLEKFFTTISAKSARTYNEAHGTLLAIKYLTISSSAARQILLTSKNSLMMLLAIAAWESPMPSNPPCCMETAITTLFSCVDDLGAADQTQLVAVCWNIIARLGDLDTIGSAKLGAATGAGLCRLALRALWKTSADDNSFNTRLDEVSALLTSDYVDVRLAAVKTFKKCIYQNIDHLLADEQSQQLKSHAFAAIGKMLLDALHKELRRDASPCVSLGTHPPTVRRLARCFLECSTALDRVAVDGGNIVEFLAPETRGLLWEVSTLIIQRETTGEGKVLEVNGETPLSSSAAEIMSIDIATAAHTPGGSTGYKTESQKQNCIGEFVQLVQRLNNPQLSWRSRYSAAIAIESSQLLSPTTSVVQDEDLAEARSTLISEVLRMLQDGDPDVRKAASRVASRLTTTSSSSNDPILSASALPQLVLESVYAPVHLAAKNATSGFLLTSILENCNGIGEKITFLQDEMSHSLAGSTSSLLNVATSRKIFEDEDPNPFEERILGNQLAVQVLLNMPSCSSSSSVEEGAVQQELLGLCLACLELLQKNLKRNEMVHELTRFPTIFPTLHSLILASCVVIYSGWMDGRGVQTAARTFVDTAKRNGSLTQPHPEILHVLELLSDLQKGDEENRRSIGNCCFLLTK